MAYNKRTWKARQGTGLNYFSINGATPVPIVNQPTTLTEAGDALSAGNLNDWEQRIADGFDSASGELADAVEELESEDTALRSAINANSNRIANLEQKAGDYSIVQYRGTNAVPTGKAKYGLVKSIVGKTRAWNQLVNTLITGTSVVGGVTVNVESTSFTINSGTGSSSESLSLMAGIPITKGHKFLLFGCFAQLYVNNQWYENYGDTYASTWDSGGVYTAGETGEIRIQCYIRSGITYTTKKYVPKLDDLTTIFGAGNEPSTVADALAQLPALGEDNDYDAGSLVDTVVSEVKSVGLNVIDGVFEDGSIDSTTGQDQANNNFVRTKNYNPIKPSTGYYFKIPSTCYAFWYDANKNYISYTTTVNGADYTSPSNAFFMRLVSVTKPYGNDIQVCLNSLDSAVKQTYHAPMESTLMLSAPVTLKSAGSVSEVLDVQTGKKTRPIGSVTYDGSDDETWSQYSTNTFFSVKSDMKSASSSVLANLICNRLVNVIRDNIYNAPNTICTESTYFMVTAPSTVTDVTGFKAWLASNPVTINYELATPDPDEQVCDPIPDNTIEVEGGGTINTIQEQSPVIDNCLDVGYLAV